MADMAPYIRTIRSLWARLQGKHFDGERDLYDVCGYPRNLTPTDYLGEYLRQGIGSRIVDAFPDATWREPPTIKGKNEESDGPFAKQIEEKLINAYNLWNVLTRLDRLTGLGHYGALLIGVAGAEPLHKPLDGNSHKLIYLSPHGERSAEITRWNDSPTSPRFGKPYSYRMTIGVSWTGLGGTERSVNVHHSRVIHIAEKPLDDESIGQPRLERIWNRLMDLDKLLGGSAEVYWQNAAPLRQWMADKDAEWEPTDKEEMKAQLEDVMHKLRRDVRLQGVKGEILAAPFEDPGGAIDKQLDMIAGATGIPKRILIGSERGELSSEQDENNWAARIAERREQFATPMIIRPFVDKMIEVGYLTAPDGGYDVEWPESDALGEEKRATIALTKAQAVQAYVAVPGTELVVPQQEFRRWLGEEEESEFVAPDADLGAIEGELDENDPEAVDMFQQLRANAAP